MKGRRVPSMVVDDVERRTLVEQLAAFRRAYLKEFKSDGGDDLTLISFVVVALADIREREGKL